MPRAPCPFLRALEAYSEMPSNEKEGLMGKIQELQEAGEFLQKQPEAEGEVKSRLQQEASRLSLENRVRSGGGWLPVCWCVEQGKLATYRMRTTAVDQKAFCQSTLCPYLKDR